MLAADAEGAPVGQTYKDGIAWANGWVIPKGSPHAISPTRRSTSLWRRAAGQASGVEDLWPGAECGNRRRATPETQKILVMSPDNIKDMLIINEAEARKYMLAYEEKWNQLMLE